jgi:Pro-kumamolisin, activation domain
MLAIVSTATSSAQNWVNTATQAVGPALANAISQGNLPDSTPIHVNVGLQIQNRDALVAYVKHINTPGDSLYGQELDPLGFAANCAPSKCASAERGELLEQCRLPKYRGRAEQLDDHSPMARRLRSARRSTPSWPRSYRTEIRCIRTSAPPKCRRN